MLDYRPPFTLGNAVPRQGSFEFTFFYTWSLPFQSKDALNHIHLTIMTGNNSRRELEREYGGQTATQSLTVWNVITKDVEKDKAIADNVVGARAPSEAWKILESMVDDDSSERAKK